MGKSQPHEKIIRQLCKDYLIPVGIFQKGTSRVYIDDNGYFFTVIEFQPSGFSKGTHLNVGLNFLWWRKDDLGWNYPGRVLSFIEYQNDEQFEREAKPYVEKALELALFYRNLRDVEYAKKFFGEKDWGSNPIANDIRIIETGFRDEETREKIRQQRAFWHAKPSMKKMPYNEIYDESSVQ